MQKDYYQILNLTPNCTPTQLSNSFRRLSLRWHPKKAKQDQQTSNYHFAQVCEAYDVLSDPVKRSYFDRYGWKKFTEDYFKDSGMNAGWKFGKNSEQIFENFFSSTKVMDQLVDREINNKGSIFSNAFGSLNQTQIAKTTNLHITVPCTLSQLFQGSAKIVKFQKHILGLDGSSIELKQVQKIIQIVPGCSQGVTLLFPGQGTQSISFPPSDLIFTITQIPHPLYTRSGNNLIYKSNIYLCNAISCEPLQIVTLDNRKLRISLDQIPNPNQVKQVIGQGMPIKGTNNKGNLYIKFNIIFPKQLTQNTKTELRKLLSSK